MPAMTSFFSTMPMAQSQRSLQFIPYTGPPDPKPAPRRVQLKKVPPSDDEYPDIDDFLCIEPDWNIEGGNGDELATTAHAVGVVDATCSAGNESSYEFDGSRIEIVDVGSDDTTNEWEDVSISTTQQASQLPSSTGSSQEDVIVINDSDDNYEAKADNQSGYTKRNDDFSLHQHHESSTVDIKLDNDDRQRYTPIDSDDNGGNRSVRAGRGYQEQENPSAVIPKSPPEECSIRPHDIIRPAPDDIRAHRSVGVPQQGLGLAPRARAGSESLYLTSSDGEAQDVVPPSDSLAITKAQSQKIERVVDQSESRAFEIASRVGNSESESDSDSDDKGHAWRLSDTQVVRKRKRGASVCYIANKRHSRGSIKTSKLRPTAAADTTKQQKQLHHLHRSRKAQPATCIPETRYGDDTSAEDNSDDTETHHNIRSAKAENSKKAHELELDCCNSPNEDTEYEVKRILAVRLRHGNLQYRVLWVGYEADSNWYNASNFKNSPRKLREFHEAKPTKPGPPARLSHWEQCWDEDRDAADFPDDDQPERTA